MSIAYKDYYKILGVEQSADKDTISKAYKKLAKKYHPDLNPGNTEAENKFTEITEAYEVLKDDEKRRMYDQLGSNWQHGQQFQGAQGFDQFNFSFDNENFHGGGFSDFFESLFGGSSSRSAGFSRGYTSAPQRGRDIEADLNISLEDSIRGGKQKVTLQTTEGPKTFNIQIPVAVHEGSKLRLSGQGYTSRNNGPKGDLYLKVKFKQHKVFSVEDANIVYEAKIAPWEAVLGKKIRIPTLEGEVDLSVPPGTSSGRRMRLKGKGLGVQGGGRGDLFVSIAISIPSELTDTQRKLWEDLAAVSTE